MARARVSCLVLVGLVLAACAAPVREPQVGLNMGVTPQGVRVTPNVATNVGGVRLGVNPYGGRISTRVGGVGIGIGL